jgi:hypothetical protein
MTYFWMGCVVLGALGAWYGIAELRRRETAALLERIKLVIRD